MIAIQLKDIENLNKWYDEVMVDYLLEKQKSIDWDSLGKTPEEQLLAGELRNLTKAQIQELTQFPQRDKIDPNAERPFHAYIQSCLKLCPTLLKYLALCDAEANAPRASKALTKDEKTCKKGLDKIVKKLFNYGEALSKAREQNEKTKKWRNVSDKDTPLRQLKQRLGVRICPYCNRQYIQTVEVDGRYTSLADADHILRNSIYPLFSLSLWNLVPCCMPCNRVFKLQKTRPILNPHVRGFGDDCILELHCTDPDTLIGLAENMEPTWTVQPGVSDKIRNLMENNISMFHLNELYSDHKGDIRRLLRQRFVAASRGYRESVLSILQPDSNLSPTKLDEMFNEMVYSVSLNSSRFQDELLSKMAYDVICHN